MQGPCLPHCYSISKSQVSFFGICVIALFFVSYFVLYGDRDQRVGSDSDFAKRVVLCVSLSALYGFAFQKVRSQCMRRASMSFI